MNSLATVARAAQIQAHAFHNLVSGPNFLELHEFLGDLYSTYEGIFDDVVERMIGKGMAVNPIELTAKAAQRAGIGNNANTPMDMFRRVLTMEQAIVSAAESENQGATLGTQNFLQGICDESEKRQYKIKQILKNAATVTS